MTLTPKTMIKPLAGLLNVIRRTIANGTFLEQLVLNEMLLPQATSIQNFIKGKLRRMVGLCRRAMVRFSTHCMVRRSMVKNPDASSKYRLTCLRVA